MAIFNFPAGASSMTNADPYNKDADLANLSGNTRTPNQQAAFAGRNLGNSVMGFLNNRNGLSDDETANLSGNTNNRGGINQASPQALFGGYASGLADIQMEAAQQRANRERMFQDSINNLDKNWQFRSLANPWGPNNAGLNQSKMNVQGQTGGQLQSALLDSRRNLAQRGIYADSGLAQNQDLRDRLAAAKQNSQMMGALDAENYNRAGQFDERQNDLYNRFNEAKSKARYVADQDQLNNLQEEMRYYQGLQRQLPGEAMDLERRGTDLASYKRLLPSQEAALRSQYQYQPQANQFNLNQMGRDDRLAQHQYDWTQQNMPTFDSLQQMQLGQAYGNQVMAPVRQVMNDGVGLLGKAGNIVSGFGGLSGGGDALPPVAAAPTNLGTYGMARPGSYRAGITPYASDYGY